MRCIGLVILTLCMATASFAAEAPPQAASLALVLKQGAVSRYNVKVQVTGTTKLPGADKPVPVDAVLDIVVSHAVGQISEDGSIQMSIAAERASAVISGQKMELPRDVFPTMTALLDKNGEVTRLFAADPMGMRLPGINYKNLILLFNPYAPAGDLKPGATWKKTLSLPPEAGKYDLNCTLEAFEDVADVHSAKVKMDINIIAPEGSNYTAKGFAVTNFSLDGARLLKSHAEMTVKMLNPGPKVPGGGMASDNPGDIDAVVKIDIIPAVTAPVSK